MIQVEFAERASQLLQEDKDVIGLAVGGSWLTNELDEFSDLDLILVTREKISDSKDKMLAYAKRLGNLLSGFTGEHVGEPRVLICLYDDPLLHVDLKFLTLSEFQTRAEDPILLLDPDGQLQEVLDTSTAQFPYPDYQWIEDRFWIWVHYALLKIGRGEYLEAFDFFGYLRMVVLGPLLHLKKGNLPRGVRKVERDLESEDLILLKQTIPAYDRHTLLESLKHSVALYRSLRTTLFKDVIFQKATEEKVMRYFEKIQANEQ
ncbi:aminoglycoside 6-adenylyltransferase [Rufibacter aurantiacus]|uniref:aminoglycoside 6-adenylyltransferase n=1 Tax=Rufibacter aurantiacus TaxID=2817374 RepID=UPI001B31837E|nr:aminoglycoside 6-adenylyltransferase [Rufibacter aurantiacus]